MACLLSVGARAGEPSEQSSDRGDPEEKGVRQRRAEWFYGQRAYPLRSIPPGVRLRGLAQMDRMVKRQRMLAARRPVGRASANATGQWTPVGPEPTVGVGIASWAYSGRVTSLAVDPRDANVVYLGAAQGGVWKTTDGGVKWQPLTDDQASLAVGSIALDPSNPDIIYVGTGEQTYTGLVQQSPNAVPLIYSYFGAGILKSTNGGRQWTNLGNRIFGGPLSAVVGGATIGALAVHPNNGQIVLAGVQRESERTSGIYRSINGCVSWTNVLPGAAGTEVFFDRCNGSVAYAALGSSVLNAKDNGVYESTDSGQTWTRLPGTGANVLPSVPTSRVGDISLTQVPCRKTLYASVGDAFSGTSLGVFKTTDGGQNWTALPSPPNYCISSCSIMNVIRVDPAVPDTVFLGGVYIFRSEDGGTTWKDIYAGDIPNMENNHYDFHAFAFARGKMYVGNDGGVWSARRPRNIEWINLNHTLSITQFYSGISIHPTNAGFGFGGTQDNGFQRYSGTVKWEQLLSGDVGWTVIDHANPSTVYLSHLSGIDKSTANGHWASYTTPMAGINAYERKQFIAPLAMDPSDSQTLYYGTFRVYQTRNGAASWTPISTDLTAGCPPGVPCFTGPVLSAIAVAPSSPATVYVGTSEGRVQVSGNAVAGSGALWSDRSAGIPPRSITRIAVDPLDENIAYVTFSGFTGFVDRLGHVFRTSNLGTSWTDISANLPNLPVNDIVLDPDIPDTLYIATDGGVLFTSNGGRSWAPLGTGLPRAAVTGLTLHRPSRTLRAGTYGRSVWDLNVPLPAVTLSHYLRHTPTGASMLGTLSSDGVATDLVGVGSNFVALQFTPADLGYGPDLFYYLRQDAAGFSTFGTISTSGAVVDRFGVGNHFEALTFVPEDLGFGPDLFYYLRQDSRGGMSTFGTISTSGAIIDHFQVGMNFDALTFAAPDLGYGRNLFYYLRHSPGKAVSTLGTIAARGVVTDRFVAGDHLDALSFRAEGLRYGPESFHYARRDPAATSSEFGTISPAGVVTHRFGVGHIVDALAAGPP